MINVRSPLRISLGGGGTDLPSYYEKFGGFVLSAAIDKYAYVAVHHSWLQDYFLKYSQMERVSNIDEKNKEATSVLISQPAICDF
jgi:D-glycero-alpha-D-manno-heptose-7-phosphate kinase